MKQKIEIALEIHVLISINSCKLHSYEKKCPFFSFSILHLIHKINSERLKDQVNADFSCQSTDSIYNLPVI